MLHTRADEWLFRVPHQLRLINSHRTNTAAAAAVSTNQLQSQVEHKRVHQSCGVRAHACVRWCARFARYWYTHFCVSINFNNNTHTQSRKGCTNDIGGGHHQQQIAGQVQVRALCVTMESNHTHTCWTNYAVVRTHNYAPLPPRRQPEPFVE